MAWWIDYPASSEQVGQLNAYVSFFYWWDMTNHFAKGKDKERNMTNQKDPLDVRMDTTPTCINLLRLDGEMRPS
jgi:hypothetical protein